MVEVNGVLVVIRRCWAFFLYGKKKLRKVQSHPNIFYPDLDSTSVRRGGCAEERKSCAQEKKRHINLFEALHGRAFCTAVKGGFNTKS
jgi:hypothetical protein